MKKLVWYHVCNDMSLEIIEGEKPNLEDMRILDMWGNVTLWGYDMEEGALYAEAEEGKDGHFIF